jgi:urease accessory protein
MKLMFAASSPSETASLLVRQPRVDGGVRVSFRQQEGRTALNDCEERDGYRIRFPKGGAGCEGVIINTGGGVAGGDRVRHAVSLSENASATLTTQAAERIYRSQGDLSQLDVLMKLENGTSLSWLPQETILYAQANLVRRFEIDMHPGARLLIVEIVVFGRKEMGETIGQGRYLDRWRVRRDGRLVFAENVRFEGDLDSALRSPAIGNGARITGTILYVAEAAAARLEAVRRALTGAASRIAASTWNGLLCIRCLGTDLDTVRRELSHAIVTLRQEPMPRVWWT